MGRLSKAEWYNISNRTGWYNIGKSNNSTTTYDDFYDICVDRYGQPVKVEDGKSRWEHRLYAEIATVRLFRELPEEGEILAPWASFYMPFGFAKRFTRNMLSFLSFCNENGMDIYHEGKLFSKKNLGKLIADLLVIDHKDVEKSGDQGVVEGCEEITKMIHTVEQEIVQETRIPKAEGEVPNWNATLEAMETVMSNVKISCYDCGSIGARLAKLKDLKDYNQRYIGDITGLYRLLAEDFIEPFSGEIWGAQNRVVDDEFLKKVEGYDSFLVRTPAKCEAVEGVCACCYGVFSSGEPLPEIGANVGLKAVNSLKEPMLGTRIMLPGYTMGEIADTVESDWAGTVRYGKLLPGMFIDQVRNNFNLECSICLRYMEKTDVEGSFYLEIEPSGERYPVYDQDVITVEEGQCVEKGTILMQRRHAPRFATTPEDWRYMARAFDLVPPPSGTPFALYSPIDGKVIITPTAEFNIIVQVIPESGEPFEQLLSSVSDMDRLTVEEGNRIAAGDQILRGFTNYIRLLQLLEKHDFVNYWLKRMQDDLKCRCLKVHDRDLELILSQMMKWVEITDSGSTDFQTGSKILMSEFMLENEAVISRQQKPAAAMPILVGFSEMVDMKDLSGNQLNCSDRLNPSEFKVESSAAS